MKKNKIFILSLMIAFCCFCSISLFACGTVVEPEGIRFENKDGTPLTEITLYKDGFTYINQYLKITPSNANGYTLQWSTSDEKKVELSMSSTYEVRMTGLDYTYDEPVTISCKIKDTSLEATFKVNVTDGNPYNLFIDQTVQNTVYYEGQEFNRDVLIVWGQFESGEYHMIPQEDLIVQVDSPLKVGSVLKVRYGTLETEIALNVVKDEVVSLNIDQYPTTVNYKIGEYFDPSGMIISATYSSGKTQVITDYSYSDAAFSYNDNSITLSYEGAQVILPLNITADITVSSYALLQDAIDSAEVGDSIMIGGNQHINVGTIYIPISKNLTIYGKTLSDGFTNITANPGQSVFKIVCDSSSIRGNTLTIANLEISSSSGASLISFDDEKSTANLTNFNITLENVSFDYDESSTGLNLSASSNFSPSQIMNITINIKNCSFSLDAESEEDKAIYLAGLSSSSLNIEESGISFSDIITENCNELSITIDGMAN